MTDYRNVPGFISDEEAESIEKTPHGFISDEEAAALENTLEQFKESTIENLPWLGAMGGTAVGVGTPVGPVGGAALGGYGGAALKNVINRYRGHHDAPKSELEYLTDPAEKGLTAASSEALMGAIPPKVLKPLAAGAVARSLSEDEDKNKNTALAAGGAALLGSDRSRIVKDYIKNLGKKGVAKFTEFTTAVPSGATEKLIEKPAQVMEASKNPEYVFNTAEKAHDELLRRDSLEDQAIGQARKQFRDEFGRESVDTKSVLQDLDSFINKHLPTKDGYGALLPKELEKLEEIRAKALVTLKAEARSKDGQLNLPLASGEKRAGDLQKFADYLANEVKNFDQSKIPGTGDTRYQAYLRSLYGKVKGLLHELDPAGLTVADKKFSDYASKASSLKPLGNHNRREAFVDNFYTRNKEGMRKDAKELIPESIDDLESISAAKAFSSQGPSGSPKGRRTLIGSAIGIPLGAHGVKSDDPVEVLLGLSVMAATSPSIMMATIGNVSKLMESKFGSQWITPFVQNPELIKMIGSAAIRKQVESQIKSAQVKDRVRMSRQ